MKRFVFSLTLAMLISGVSLAEDCHSSDFPSDELHAGEEVLLVDSVFAPQGFDSNDRIEAVVTGWKPSPCFGEPKSYVERVGNDVRITVKAVRRVTRDRLCIDMAVPFLLPVRLPQMPAGEYNIYVNHETAVPQFAKMQIAAPTNESIDDFLYPDVEYIKIDPKTRIVEIVGENPSPCYVLDRIISTSNGSNTYALMPIMQKKDVICTQQLTPFKYTYRLPNDIQASKVLVHVRTIDGKSKNKVFSMTN